MSIPLCPYLPLPEAEMSYRSLRELRGGDIEAFYRTALGYGHYLWLKGCSGRAILTITRALYADLPDGGIGPARMVAPIQSVALDRRQSP
jgi:hypothetical protein